MIRTLFWLGLPLRIVMAGLVWLVMQMLGLRCRVDWRKVAWVGLDQGVEV